MLSLVLLSARRRESEARTVELGSERGALRCDVAPQAVTARPPITAPHSVRSRLDPISEARIQQHYAEVRIPSRFCFADAPVPSVPAPRDLPAFSGRSPASDPREGGRGDGTRRQRWKVDERKIYEWDSQHGSVELYDSRGRHLGEFDPVRGPCQKGANSSRRSHSHVGSARLQPQR